jgi:hypothetical protein
VEALRDKIPVAEHLTLPIPGGPLEMARRLKTVEFDEYGYMSELFLNLVAIGAAALIVFWCWILFEIFRAKGEED